MKRREDWPSRFAGILAELDSRMFSYGEHDCALATADIIRAYTDTDLADEWRNDYIGRKEALRILVDYEGVAGLAQYIATKHGLEEVDPAFAQRGDAVLVSSPLGDAFGVVDLDGVHAVCAAGRGLIRIPGPFLRAWRI